MEHLESAARNAATIVMQERHRIALAIRDAMEAVPVDTIANVTHMEAARDKAYRVADDADEEGRVAEVVASAMAWALLGKEEEEEASAAAAEAERAAAETVDTAAAAAAEEAKQARRQRRRRGAQLSDHNESIN
jgi:hypothetical protein